MHTRAGARYKGRMVDVDEALRRLAEHHDTPPRIPTIDEVTAEYVARVVELHAGNRSAAARALNIHPSTVARWLERRR